MSENKPTVYLCETDDGVEISSYSIEDERNESYKMTVKEVVNHKTTHSATVNVLRNILSQAGVKVVLE